MKQEILKPIRNYKLNPRSSNEEPDPNYREDIHTSEEEMARSPVKQSEAESCDINVIMKRFEATGFLPSNDGRTPTYGDFTTAETFQEALHITRRAEENFMQLNAHARAEFDNDPAKFLAYIEQAQTDGKKADRLVELGLAVLTPAKGPDPVVQAVEKLTNEVKRQRKPREE